MKITKGKLESPNLNLRRAPTSILSDVQRRQSHRCIKTMIESTVPEGQVVDSNYLGHVYKQHRFYKTKDDYTKKLLGAIPEGAKTLPNRSIHGSPLIDVSNLKTYFKNQSGRKDNENQFVFAFDV